MNTLITNTKTIDSREVAEMVDMRHADLIRKIEGYVDAISTNAKLRSLDYFIENTYVDKKGESRKCYELTKMGCEMVANKLTGEKGILFTAEYVKRFNDMEQVEANQFKLPQTYAEALRELADKHEALQLAEAKNKQQEQIIGELQPKVDYMDTILQNPDIVPITVIAKDYGMSGQEMNKLLHKFHVIYKVGKQWLLYSEHQAKGYTHSKTDTYHHKDGSVAGIYMNTQWTQKGRLFLYNLLKKHDVFPLIEQLALPQ